MKFMKEVKSALEGFRVEVDMINGTSDRNTE
jgi:hypothetical protein